MGGVCIGVGGGCMCSDGGTEIDDDIGKGSGGGGTGS
jgi:hypothetical protein